LFFFDEVQTALEKALKDKPNCIKFILTDHNRLAKHQEHYGDFIVDIIDHHKEEGLYPKATRSIEMVGSCATLVAERVFSNDIFTGDSGKGPLKMLLGTILLDTVNLDPKYKKVTKKDEDIVKMINSKLGFSEKQQTALFDKLQEERFNVSSLGSIDLLLSDYKQWTMGKLEVGVSSAKLSLKEWLQKEPNFEEKLTEYYVSRKLDMLMVMTAYLVEDNKFKRELVVYTQNKDLYNPVVEYLSKSELEINPMEETLASSSTNSIHTIGFFSQNNVGASRKQLQPLLDTFYAPK